MTGVGRFLGLLYAVCALALAHTAVRSYEAGSAPYALLLAACSLAALTAACHTWHLRDELRSALVRLERAARPIPDPTPAPIPAPRPVSDCCDLWWATAGADHDTEHCTRKGHHA